MAFLNDLLNRGSVESFVGKQLHRRFDDQFFFFFHMHSLILVDEENSLLTRSITWADNRSSEWAEKIKREMNGMEIYQRTGTPIHPMSPLVKLAWLRHDEPELFAKAAKFISIKEFIFHRLFDKYVIDYSIACKGNDPRQ